MIKIATLFFKHFNVLKGHPFTFVGISVIGIALYIMVDAKSITSEGIELLTLGLTVSGINNEMLSKIKSRNNDTTQP